MRAFFALPFVGLAFLFAGLSLAAVAISTVFTELAVLIDGEE